MQAIRLGEVDAVVVSGPEGERVYSLTSVERIYRDMVETMSESALNVNSDGMILYCNERFARMTKTDLVTVIGSNLLSHFVEMDRDSVSSLLDSAATGVKRTRAGLRGADGLVLPVNVATHAREADDQPYTIITIITDLTEILAAQASTMTALRYARHLIEAILDPLITIDTDGKITDVNHATELVTGRTSTELIGTSFADHFTEATKARNMYEQVFLKGYVLDAPLAARNTSGGAIEMLFNASLYREDDGTAGGVVAVGRDVTRHYDDRVRAKRGKRRWAVGNWPLLGVALVGFSLLAVALTPSVDAWIKSRIVTPVSAVEKPYLHVGDHQPTSIFHAGEIVFSHAWTRRNMACFVLGRQRILSFIDGDIHKRIIWTNLPVTEGYTPAGSYETDLRFTLPDSLPEGAYVFERNITWTCEGININQSQSSTPFMVTK